MSEKTVIALSILKRARDRIERGSVMHICNAISDVSYEAIAKEMRCKVAKSIDGLWTMEEWAYRSGLPIDYESMRAMRLRWLDAWIEAHKCVIARK